MQKFCPELIRGYSDRGQLKKLWGEAFGDSEKYLDFLYDCGYLADSYVWALADSGNLLCACACLPLCGRDTCVYLCYAATFRAFQKQGLMSCLIHAVKASGCEIALIPEEESLFDFYKKQGFEPSLFLCRKHFRHDSPCGRREIYSPESFDLESVYLLYRQTYAAYRNVLYKSYETFRAAVLESVFFPGGGFCRCGGGYGFVLLCKGRLYLREPFGNWEMLVRSFSEITVEMPPEKGDDKTPVGFFYSPLGCWEGSVNHLLNE